MRPAPSIPCLLLWLAALTAGAAPYEAEVEVGAEWELLQLAQLGQLPGESVEVLRELLRTGVDLASAPRAQLSLLPGLTRAEVDALVAWRQGRAVRPGALVAAGLLSPRRLAQLEPFLQPSLPGAPGPAWALRLEAAASPADVLAPALLLQGRARWGPGLSGGVLLVGARRRLGTPQGAGAALEAAAPVPTLVVPKAHLHWRTPGAEVLVGSFRVGFGQRLTLDTTGLPAPEGLVPDQEVGAPDALAAACPLSPAAAAQHCAPAVREGRVTPDFSWREGFRGLAGGLRALPLGAAVHLSATAFASHQRRAVYQYDVLDTGRCRQGGCASPPLYLGPVEEGARLAWQTLPEVVEEVAAGGNLGLTLPAGGRLGVTAWGAAPHWRPRGLALDFRPSAPYPRGGPFGAVGVEGGWEGGGGQLLAEVARSFDSAPGGGGDVGALVRGGLSAADGELELSLRYYGPAFTNPYARPPAAADEDGGQRARNEAGLRLRALVRGVGPLVLRGQLDSWLAPRGEAGDAPGPARLAVLARADWQEGGVRPGLGLEHTTAPLTDTCPLAACAAPTTRLTARLAGEVGPALRWTVLSAHRWVAGQPSSWRLAAGGTLRPLPALRLLARAGWRSGTDDVSSGVSSDEGEGLSTVLEAGWQVAPWGRVRTRWAGLLPLASSVPAGAPLPRAEHRFHLELEVRP